MDRRVLRRGALAGLALGLAAAPLWVGWGAQRMAERRLGEVLASVPGATWSFVEAGRGTLAVRDLRLLTGGAHISIGLVSLPTGAGALPALVGSARAEDGIVALDDVRITLGTTLVVVPHLEARGTSLDGAGLRAVLDPASGLSGKERLARFSAAALSAATVVVKGTNESQDRPDDSLTLHDVTLTDIAAGRIGALTSSGLTLPMPKMGEAPGQMSSGRIAITDLDLPLILDIATGSRQASDAPLTPVYTRISVDAFKVVDAHDSFDLGSFASGAFRARPLLRTVADSVALADKPFSTQTPEEQRALVATAVDAAKSFALDRIELRGLAFVNHSSEQVDAKLDRFLIADYRVLNVGVVAANGFALQTKDADIAFDNVRIDGYDQSAAVNTFVAMLMRTGLNDVQDQAFGLRPRLASTALDNLRIAVPSPNRAGNSPDGSSILVDVPTFSIGVADKLDGSGVDSSAHLQVTMPLPSSSKNPALASVAQAGISGIDLRSDYAASYGTATQMLNLDRFAVEFKDLASLSLSAVLGNVSPDLFNAAKGTPAAEEAAQQISFRNLSVSLQDSGLFDKVFKAVASTANMSVPLLKAETKGQVQVAVQQALGATPSATKITQAVSTFIDNPRSLRISVKAPDGLSLRDAAAVADPQSLLGKLEIEAVANQ